MLGSKVASYALGTSGAVSAAEALRRIW